MIRIGILGDIGSGKSHVAKLFGYPTFNADLEVYKLYKKNKKCYYKLKKSLPNYITSFPIKKYELSKAILANQINLRKITKIIHPAIRSRMNKFVKKNKTKKIIVLDIPLLLENKINNNKDILIFVEAKREEINKRLRKRNKMSYKMIKMLKRFQLPVEVKKKKSDFIIKNNFKNNFVKKNVKNILKEILINV